MRSHGFEQGWILRFHFYTEGFTVRAFDNFWCRRYHSDRTVEP